MESSNLPFCKWFFGYAPDDLTYKGFFTTVESVHRGKPRRTFKRGRDSENRTPVMVMVESKRSKERKKGRPLYSCSYFKMEAMPDLTSNTVEEIVQESLDQNCRVKTDNYSSVVIAKLV